MNYQHLRIRIAVAQSAKLLLAGTILSLILAFGCHLFLDDYAQRLQNCLATVNDITCAYYSSTGVQVGAYSLAASLIVLGLMCLRSCLSRMGQLKLMALAAPEDADILERLGELREQGLITDQEYDRFSRRVALKQS